MASGHPDHNRASVIKGLNGTTLVPVAVDSAGQMYIALTGQAISVANLPSDYYKSSETIAGIDNNVTVEQNNSDRNIKGSDGTQLRYVALDTSGIMLARMKGANGSALYDIAVDTDGLMLARMKGNHSGSLADIALDSSGNIIGRVQGYDGAALRDVLVDPSGRLISSIQGKVADEQVMRTISDCGDTDLATNWGVEDDALSVEADANYGRDGSYGYKVTVDASKSAQDYANIRTTQSQGDLTDYADDYISLWLYIPDISIVEPTGIAFSIFFGSSAGDFCQYATLGTDLQQGWTRLTYQISAPTDTVGSPDWAAIDNVSLGVVYVASNTTDTVFGVDTIEIVRRSANYGNNIDIATTANGSMRAEMVGQYNGSPKILATDSTGIMRADLALQSGATIKIRPLYGQIKSYYGLAVNQAAGYYTLVDEDVYAPGIVIAGNVAVWASGSRSGAYLRLTVDGDEMITDYLSGLYDSGLTVLGSSIVWCCKYDEVNYLYGFALTPGFTFSTSIKLELYLPADATGYKYRLNTQY